MNLLFVFSNLLSDRNLYSDNQHNITNLILIMLLFLLYHLNRISYINKHLFYIKIFDILCMEKTPLKFFNHKRICKSYVVHKLRYDNAPMEIKNFHTLIT